MLPGANARTDGVARRRLMLPRARIDASIDVRLVWRWASATLIVAAFIGSAHALIATFGSSG